MQTMCRVDRRLNAEPGTNVFKIHLPFDTLVTMFIHIKQETSANEHATQHVALFEVLEPVECYYYFLEHYLEVMQDKNKQSCGAFHVY